MHDTLKDTTQETYLQSIILTILNQRTKFFHCRNVAL